MRRPPLERPLSHPPRVSRLRSSSRAPSIGGRHSRRSLGESPGERSRRDLGYLLAGVRGVGARHGDCAILRGRPHPRVVGSDRGGREEETGAVQSLGVALMHRTGVICVAGCLDAVAHRVARPGPAAYDEICHLSSDRSTSRRCKSTWQRRGGLGRNSARAATRGKCLVITS